MSSVCVFTASSPGTNPAYRDAAWALGATLARERVRLVYGGARVGLMGELADSVRAHDGEVVGVMPRNLVDWEVAHEGLSELRVVTSMHERKAQMSELADAFAALPGGLGTLEELFEVWTWSQLGLHAKPVALLDPGGFWQPLLGFLDGMVSERLLRREDRERIVVADDPDTLLDRLRTAEPATVSGKWLDNGPAHARAPGLEA
ncbi:TIGR00730 family Rossman fold protein [Egibacter rhizosphaerae]|uniref:Cytokinin riboside 5'-monophosphate phosphoribohydrolase n=1 Tax=Egibacter rhizosphaerae TaxID=1670831 RepID=A0A411YL69_9ACTN|nr:TIGR00730 family Rossman fold protein [Egibacter rhizosphaerae]